MIYRSFYVDKIMKFVDIPVIKILTGIRRCGKSTIMDMLMERLKGRGVKEENIISIRLSEIEYEDMTSKELYGLIEGRISKEGKTYLFLDEIQEVKNWERVVNTFFEKKNLM